MSSSTAATLRRFPHSKNDLFFHLFGCSLPILWNLVALDRDVELRRHQSPRSFNSVLKRGFGDFGYPSTAAQILSCQRFLRNSTNPCCSRFLIHSGTKCFFHLRQSISQVFFNASPRPSVNCRPVQPRIKPCLLVTSSSMGAHIERSALASAQTMRWPFSRLPDGARKIRVVRYLRSVRSTAACTASSVSAVPRAWSLASNSSTGGSAQDGAGELAIRAFARRQHHPHARPSSYRSRRVRGDEPVRGGCLGGRR